MKDAAAKHEAPDRQTSTSHARANAQGAWGSNHAAAFATPGQFDTRYAAGNMAVQRLLRAGAIQAKLAVSQPGDFYEREADRVAEEVLRAPGALPARPVTQAGRAEPGGLQRKCGCEGGAAQGGACEECAEKRLNLQRRPAGGAGETAMSAGGSAREGRAKGQGDSKSGAGVGEVLRSAGRPLDAAARAFFEPRFGMNLGGVRVHSDAKAAESARGVNALAYTVGRDIVFGAGRYDAGSDAGRRLLAHELAHVIQQDFGSGLPAAAIQRQGDPPGQPAPGPQPEAPADPNVPIPPPPEHAERAARLEEMGREIYTGTEARQDLQAQIRNVPIGPPTEEEQASRDAMRTELTLKEESLAAKLEERIALINESLAALQQLLPGVSPSAPSGEYSAQSEIYRLTQEKIEDEAQLLLLKRCLSRKRIRQIEAKVAELPPGTSQEVTELGEERQKELDFLKSSASSISCMKRPGQARHPTKVSPAAFAKMKLGEGLIRDPYVALEGEKKGVGGCTIGFGHVITTLDGGRTCEHAEGPMPDKPAPAQPGQAGEPGEKPKEEKLGPHLMKVGNLILRRCICKPGWHVEEPEAIALAEKDIGVHIAWIKQHVLVDLDQGQFDALVDISLAVGSVPQSLIDVIHSKICVDDEAVRQQYMKTALYTRDNPERGPIHAKRRKERVWAPKGDDDPTCV